MKNKSTKYPDLRKITLLGECPSLDPEQSNAFQTGLDLVNNADSFTDKNQKEAISYTFETHPFYSQLGDYSNIEIPDTFDPSLNEF